MNKNRVEQRALISLREHPEHARLAIAKSQIERLAQEMLQGQWDPVEILTDGTILFGHRFVRAARNIGWRTIEVVVRDDIQGAKAIRNYVTHSGRMLRKAARGPGTYVFLRSSLGYPVPVMIGLRGCKGPMVVKRGYYAYIGSAFGGIPGRVSHHMNPNGGVKWNSDYLKPYTQPEGLWFTYDRERRECPWARIVANLPGAEQPCEKFGSNDCDCYTHLYFFPTRPSYSAFVARVQESLSEHAPVHQLVKSELHHISASPIKVHLPQSGRRSAKRTPATLA